MESVKPEVIDSLAREFVLKGFDVSIKRDGIKVFEYRLRHQDKTSKKAVKTLFKRL